MNTHIARLLISVCALALLAQSSHSQQLEPRSYVNLPTGLNFVIAGGAYQEGDMLLDPSLDVDDAVTRSKHAATGYLRSFGLFGMGAKFAVGTTYTEFTASGLLDGVPVNREDQGFADPMAKLSVNFMGSPALSLAEFRDYRQDLVVGASLGVSAPWGEYDGDKVINIGFNRWVIQPEIGASKILGRWILEASAAVAFYTDNTDFAGGKTREQDPLGSVQFHVIYRIKPGKGMWAAFDVTHYRGGQTSVDGDENDNELNNFRYGGTLALPINRRNSLKFYLSTGLNARRGTVYNLAGMAWQYRWGGGM